MTGEELDDFLDDLPASLRERYLQPELEPLPPQPFERGPLWQWVLAFVWGSILGPIGLLLVIVPFIGLPVLVVAGAPLAYLYIRGKGGLEHEGK
jgi:hypothetical protein